MVPKAARRASLLLLLTQAVQVEPGPEPASTQSLLEVESAAPRVGEYLIPFLVALMAPDVSGALQVGAIGSPSRSPGQSPGGSASSSARPSPEAPEASASSSARPSSLSLPGSVLAMHAREPSRPYRRHRRHSQVAMQLSDDAAPSEQYHHYEEERYLRWCDAAAAAERLERAWAEEQAETRRRLEDQLAGLGLEPGPEADSATRDAEPRAAPPGRLKDQIAFYQAQAAADMKKAEEEALASAEPIVSAQPHDEAGLEARAKAAWLASLDLQSGRESTTTMEQYWTALKFWQQKPPWELLAARVEFLLGGALGQDLAEQAAAGINEVNYEQAAPILAHMRTFGFDTKDLHNLALVLNIDGWEEHGIRALDPRASFERCFLPPPPEWYGW